MICCFSLFKSFFAAFCFLDVSITQKDNLNTCYFKQNISSPLLAFSAFFDSQFTLHLLLCTHPQPPLEKPIKGELKQLGISLQRGFP